MRIPDVICISGFSNETSQFYFVLLVASQQPFEARFTFNAHLRVETDTHPMINPIASLVHAANLYPWWTDSNQLASIDVHEKGMIKVESPSVLSHAMVCVHVPMAKNDSFICPEMEFSCESRLVMFFHDPLGRYANTKRLLHQFDPTASSLIVRQVFTHFQHREIVPSVRTQWWNTDQWLIGRELVIDRTRQRVCRVQPYSLFPTQYLIYIGGVMLIRVTATKETVPWTLQMDGDNDPLDCLRLIVDDKDEYFLLGVCGTHKMTQKPAKRVFKVDLRNQHYSVQWGPTLSPLRVPELDLL